MTHLDERQLTFAFNGIPLNKILTHDILFSVIVKRGRNDF